MLCSLDQESRRSSVGLSSSTKHAADRKESESKKEDTCTPLPLRNDETLKTGSLCLLVPFVPSCTVPLDISIPLFKFFLLF